NSVIPARTENQKQKPKISSFPQKQKTKKQQPKIRHSRAGGNPVRSVSLVLSFGQLPLCHSRAGGNPVR
ncbi:TPA: hypothetical protein ACFPAV_002100, partial [Neisseria meningitidis]